MVAPPRQLSAAALMPDCCSPAHALAGTGSRPMARSPPPHIVPPPNMLQKTWEAICGASTSTAAMKVTSFLWKVTRMVC